MIFWEAQTQVQHNLQWCWWWCEQSLIVRSLMYLNFNSRCLSICPPSPGPSVETKGAQPPLARGRFGQQARQSASDVAETRDHDQKPSPRSESLHSPRSDLHQKPSPRPASSRSPNVSSLPATRPEKNAEFAGAAGAGHPTAPHRMAPPYLARLPAGGAAPCCGWRALAS